MAAAGTAGVEIELEPEEAAWMPELSGAEAAAAWVVAAEGSESAPDV